MFGFPSVVRFSWRNARDLLKRSAAAVVFGDEDDDGDEEEGDGAPAKRQATMATFLAMPAGRAMPEAESIATKV